jgi:FtsH-binding integral membrane protein
VTFSITIINIFFIRSDFITALVAIAIACVYSIYLIIDTQLILGGKNQELTLDNYVLGAVLLYIDIIQLFLQILKILGKRKE